LQRSGTTTTATGASLSSAPPQAGCRRSSSRRIPSASTCRRYVGHRGWIGVRLDRGFDRDEIAGIIEDAFAEIAPPSLLPAD
jgi:hypothetical protein